MSTKPDFQNPELNGEPFFWRGNDTGILLIHGFTATTVEVRPLAEYLCQKGYSVAGPLLPGHGTTYQDLNTRSWKEWVAAADQCYQLLRSTCKRVFVGGESLGGLLSLYLASTHPEILGVMLFSPAMRVKNLWQARFARHFLAKRPKKNLGYSAKPFPWQGYTVFPVKAAYQLNLMQQQVGARLKMVAQPVIIFQGEKDRTIQPESSQIVYDGISSSNKELILLHNSGHCVVLDQEYEELIAKSNRFVESILQHHGVVSS